MNPRTQTIVELCEDLTAAQRYWADWNRLAGALPFHRWEWMASWWRELESLSGKSKLAIGIVKDIRGTVLGIAPFYVKLDWSGRSLRFLGDGRAATDYQRILAESQHAQPVGKAIGDWIDSEPFKHQFGSLDRVVFEGIEEKQPDIRSLFDSLQAKNWTLNRIPIESTWELSLAGTLQDVFRRGMESHRRKVKKLMKRLDGQDVNVEVVEQEIEFEQLWPEFVRLHQMRRQAVGQEGCFSCPRFEAFLKTATGQLLKDSQAKLVFLKKDQVRFAASLILHSKNCTFMYQTGLDAQYMEFEPGHLLNTYLIRWAHTNEATTFDFLRGDEPYKKRWGCTSRDLFRARLVAPTWSAQVKEQLWQTARTFKRRSNSLVDWLQRKPGLTVKSRDFEPTE